MRESSSDQFELVCAAMAILGVDSDRAPFLMQLYTPAIEFDLLNPRIPRAARSLVEWSREDLAKHSGVAHNTIKDFEGGKSDPKQSTLLKWMRVLQVAGVAFIDEDDAYGAGVRWKKGWPKGKR